MKPNTPNETCWKLKSSPRSVNTPRTASPSSTSGIRRVFTNDSTTAPMTTPQMLPRPPRMTMARMKIEKPNWNWLAFTLCRNVPRKAPEMPPNAAPTA